MTRGVLLLCIVTLRLALRQANGVPSSLQSSCSTELIRVKQGDTLHLQCGSHCMESSGDHSYTWWKVSEGEEGKRQQLSFTGAVVTEDEVTAESGGEYECKCGSGGQTCTFYVAILPEVTFTSSHTATHYGDVVTLKCTTDSFPANSSVVTNGFGIRMRKELKKKINRFRLETIVVVQDIEEEDYVCLVETHYRGYSIAEEKQSLKVKLYNPPSILYTTELVIHEESEFGKPGQLSCVVQTSVDTVSHVTWWSDGEQLVEGGKYRMSSSAMSYQVTVFKLHVEGVEQSDIGPYLCQLSTEYNTEESQDAWIKVDYRTEAVRMGGRLYTDDPAVENSVTYSLGKSSMASTLRTVSLLICLVVVAGLGTWGIVAHRRKRRRWSDKDGILGRGKESLPLTGSPVAHSSGTGLYVFKRR